MTRHSDSFIVTVKDDNYQLIDQLELNKYALKAQVEPQTGSKYTPSEELLRVIISLTLSTIHTIWYNC